MELYSVIKMFDEKTNEYTSNLSKEIADKFEPIKKYGLIGFDNNKFEDYYYISFRGKAYSYVVYIITNKKYGLYQDLEPKTLKLIYEEFKNFLSKFDYEPDKYMLKNIDELYETHYDGVNEWFQALTDTDQYLPSPREIKGLMELFGLCSKNNLMLYASY